MSEFREMFQEIGGFLMKQVGKVITHDGGLDDFSYNRFPPRTPSIRLLKVIDSAVAPMVISMETFPFDEAPSYHALSYTWGVPFAEPNFEVPADRRGRRTYYQSLCGGKPYMKVTCNGQRLRIGLNLHKALEHLGTASLRENVPHGYIWADAICIDQNHKPEKEAQMLMMSKIYERAVSVIVWLGETCENTTHGLVALQKLSSLRGDQLQDMKGRRISEPSTYSDLNLEYITPEEWIAFAGINRRAWFQRVWVVQEVIFAKETVYLLGTNRLGNAEILSRVSKLLVLSGWSQQILEPLMQEYGSIGGPMPGSLGSLYQMKDDLRMQGNLTPTKILVSMRSRRATEYHDRIFALLNVIALALQEEPEELPIVPNYKKELGAVLEEATLLCIRTDGNLTVFPAIQDWDLRYTSDCASWTVDWGREMSPFPLSFLHGGNEIWNPSQSPLEMPDTSQTHILRFRAAKFSAIETVDIYTNTLEPRPGLSHIDLALTVGSNVVGPPGQTLMEILSRTILADTYSESTPAPEAAGHSIVLTFAREAILGGPPEQIDTRVEALKSKLSRLRAIDSSTDIPTDDEISLYASALYNLDMETWGPLEVAAQETALDAGKALTRRRLAILRNKYMALVPASADVDDEVYVIPGMTTPFIFRNTHDGKHQILGECYVHGIMHGEWATKLHYDYVELK